MGRRRYSLEESSNYFFQRVKNRFKINDETGCWEWQKRLSNGYPMASKSGKKVLVHREVLSLKLKRPLIGLCCHSCDNSKCINPDHLFEATQKENISDMFKKNRQPDIKKSSRSRKTTKLSYEKVAEIRKLRSEGKTFKKIGDMFGVAPSTIRDIFRKPGRWA